MTPILFAESATEFNTNGTGRLTDAISCVVTEERNGQYEMEMEYPITGAHYSDIVMRAIVVVKPSADATLQPFRIYKVTKPISGRVKIFARHISYDLAKNTAMPFSIEASASACNATLQALKSNAVESCPFTFWTDVQTLAGYNQIIPASIRQRLGGAEGSVLDQFGGEYEFDGYTVKLHHARGHFTDLALRYGKNITDLSQEEAISETVTGVVPYWSDMNNTEVVTLPEKAVYSQYADRYSEKLTVPLDLSDQWDEAPTEATLRAAAQAYVTKHNLGVPAVSITVSFIDLADTVEYAQLASLQSVHLCDTINVQFEPLGIDTTAKVVKCVWNVLTEQYNEISVGTVKTSLAKSINDQNSTTATSIDKTKVQAGNAINKATAWLSSGDGYIVAVKGPDGEWKELLAMDTPDIETAQKVMRLNENGLGGSTHGVDGPYNAAILVDGTIVADAMKTGILSDLNDKFYLNMETGELVMKDGTFTGLIKGSVIRFGDDTGDNYATMDWRKVAGGVVDTLAIIANGGRPIQVESSVNSSNYARVYLNSGSGGIVTTSVAGLSAPIVSLSGNAYVDRLDGSGGNLTVAGSITSNGYHVPYSFTSGVNFSTFESNGNRYLGVYHGSNVYGFVQLTPPA